MSDDFHAERATGIGGSDAAAILGLSRHGSPWSVWARLVGLLPPTAETQRLAIGHALEGAIAQLFHAETGLYVAGEQMHVRHPEHEWLRGFVDGFVFDGPREFADIDAALGGFEAKTDGRFGWPDGVPANYQAQAQHYMLVTGLPRWWFGVLFAGFRFQVFELEANEEDQALILSAAGSLWHNHVLTGTPPPVDGSEATSDALAAVYPEHVPGTEVELDGLAEMLVERGDLKDRAKDIGKRLDEIDNTIRERLGEAEVGTFGGVPILTYRSSERAGYTVPPATIRTLRAAPKPKEGKS